MTDDKINAAIAKTCPDKFRNEDNVWFFQYAKDCWSQCHNNSICADLNAMHEAEKVLSNRLGVYGELLCEMTVVNEADFPECYIWHATARQRAEAFLRTLGKWDQATDKKSLSVGGATTEGCSADHVGGIFENCEVSMLENDEPEKPRAVQKMCSGLNVIEAFQQLKPTLFIRRAIWKNNTKLPSGIAFTSLSSADITTNDWEVWA